MCSVVVLVIDTNPVWWGRNLTDGEGKVKVLLGEWGGVA